ncbi:DNA polymerase I, partial [bacterium]|nr:DNA polymerase I [bacterium]
MTTDAASPPADPKADPKVDPKQDKRLFLVDGSSFIFRAFFAVRHLSTADGLPTNAVFGFAQMMKKLVKDFAPTHIAVVFDTAEPTFRHKIYDQYKANRDEPPEDLKPQFDLIRQLVDAFAWKRLQDGGYEADDIIGTLSDRAVAEGYEVVIVSSDKDLCQLLGPHVRMLDTMKDKWTGPDDLGERFGGGPERVVDVLALAGDTSDNIPGIPGVGEKTAVKLLDQFGSLEGVFEHADEIKGKLGEKVRDNIESARLSRRLVEIKRDMNLDLTLDDLIASEPNWHELTELLTKLEMVKLLDDLDPGDAMAHVESAISRDHYELVLDAEKLDRVVGEMKKAGAFAVDLETTSLDATQAEMVGVCLCADDGRDTAYYIPVRHSYLGVPKQLTVDQVREKLGPILADPKIKKVGQNIKYDWTVFLTHDFVMHGVAFDTMLASYVVESEMSHGMDALSLRYLNHKPIAYSEMTGTGRNQKSFAEVPVEDALLYAAEDAHVTRELWKILEAKVEDGGYHDLYYDIELPLVEVLTKMETTGVLLDVDLFKTLSKEAAKKLADLEKQIHAEAGKEFNLNSPKQLGEILFDKLGLPSGRKTKTGYSTNVAVLERLADQHPVPRLMLEYRAFHKLKSTYIDALPQMINPKTGRLHTNYNQTIAATGRLSSQDPNLQNIPIRTPEGRRIREAFIAPEGRLLLSADYSQVELRIMAHLAGDKALIEAFHQGDDIHRTTAAQVFGVQPEDVTPEMRRNSKAINFGIIYGMSAFRLGQDLEIGTKKAQEFIDTYFDRFSGVKKFIDATIKEAHEKGYVTTMMGRRRNIPELRAKDRATVGFGERIAVNTPMQGTAADIIKMAMIKLHHRIEDEKLP